MLKTYLNKAVSLFFILGFLFIPLTFYGRGFQYRVTNFLFLRPVSFIQGHFFSIAIHNIDFSSDTIGLNIMLGILLVLAFSSVLLLNVFKIKTAGVITIFRYLSAYYIAAVLLEYGFAKVFKQQFYLPEPNILYAGFGSLHKDILFWSTMGLSRSYSVVTGAVEIITAILILVKRTRMLGFCLAIGVLLNILLINFSFDISVKTFTAFLLAVVLFNAFPALKTVYAFFVRHKQVQLVDADQPAGPAYKVINLVLGIAIILYVLFPYILAGNFNDDKAFRPLLHGAYSIERFIIDADTLASCDFPYKRLFIHRNNYIIFQQASDKMTDYFFEFDPAAKQLKLQDYGGHKITINYNYVEKTGALQLRFDNSKKWVIEAKALNWKALPALQDETHYTIDEIK